MSIQTMFNKKVSGLKIKKPNEVYDSTTAKYRNPKKIFGKVNKDYMNVVLSKGANASVIEDFSSLPKSYKTEIYRYFADKKNKKCSVLYLVTNDYDKSNIKEGGNNGNQKKN